MKAYLREEAQRELNDAAWHYEEAREDLGDEFIEDFLLALTEIEEAPARWPVTRPGFRRFRMSRFPYAIVYRILSQNIEIVAIVHLARHADHWRDRLD